MEEHFSFWYWLQCLFYRTRRFFYNLRYEHCVRNKHMEFTWLPSTNEFLTFGFELNPSKAYDERSYISFGLFSLFVFYVYLPLACPLSRITKLYRRFHLTIGPEYVYVSRSKTTEHDFARNHSKSTFFDWPWNWTFEAQYYYSPDLTLRMNAREGKVHLECPDKWKLRQQYHYSWPTKQYQEGEIVRVTESQTTNATMYVSERVWKRKCLPFIRMKRRVIEVTFDHELGPGRGSWKGGVIGTSHEMLPNETPSQTLVRMMKERRFDR